MLQIVASVGFGSCALFENGQWTGLETELCAARALAGHGWSLVMPPFDVSHQERYDHYLPQHYTDQDVEVRTQHYREQRRVSW